MVTLRRGGAADLAAHADAAIEVYTRAMQRPPQVAAHRRAMLDDHLHHPALVCALAESGTALVGFGYAYPGTPGDWWYEAVARGLGPAGTADWLADCLEVVELHVLPEQQGAGIGRRLLRLLLETASARTAVLSTHDKESPARALYRSCGFVDLLTDFRFPGGTERFAIMGARLGVAAAAGDGDG